MFESPKRVYVQMPRLHVLYCVASYIWYMGPIVIQMYRGQSWMKINLLITFKIDLTFAMNFSPVYSIEICSEAVTDNLNINMST